MKLTSNSRMLAFAMLLTGQVTQALPTDSTSIVKRAAAPPRLFITDDKPIFQDLIDASEFNSTLHYKVDHDLYTNILLGFVKCEPAWVKSWFPTDEELKTLNEKAPLPEDTSFMLRYNEKDGKRRAFTVDIGWTVDEYLGYIEDGVTSDRRAPVWYGAWWPWALLEAAYNGSKDERSIESIVMTLAGEELITIKSSDADADEYWTILKEAHRSPMTVKYDGHWWTVMFTTGDGPTDGHLTLGRATFAGYEEKKDEPFSMDGRKIEEIKYLLGTPDFSSGKRKGDLEF